MKFKTNLAYSKSNSQRVQQNKIYKSSHIGRIYRSKVRVRLKFYIFSIIAAAAFLSVFILSLVKCNEINAQLIKIKKEFQIQSSENVRLKTEREQKMNIQEIEKCARARGMKNLDNSQVIYIKTSTANKKLSNQSHAKTKTSAINKILNKIKKMFSAES